LTPRQLPDGLLLGCATAAHQVEGGTANDWSRWAAAHPEAITGGGDATLAIDHYHRYRDDLAQLAAMHQTAHRFSIEWSRVEPEQGRFDADALLHYADVVRTCRELGMEPIVTLHHFTLPAWLADAGGVTSLDAPVRFARYAAACVAAFGDMVTWWITINEPAVIATLGYLEGTWPPGERSLRLATRALAGLLRMHAAGAQAIKSVMAQRDPSARTSSTMQGQRGRQVQVSIAHHERRLVPRTPGSRLERTLAALPDYLFNRWFLRSCVAGRMLAPVGHGEVVPGLAGSLTYLGLNHYANEAVSLDIRAPGMLFTQHQAVPGFPLSSTGWAIDPSALGVALASLWDEFGLPIIVTENGVADDHDELRPEYLRTHLTVLADAIDAGVDVRGYLYWTAWDNLEWAEGYTMRFGLFAVDRQTLARVAKPSAGLYAEICRTRNIPDGAATQGADV
jgi:beta-glucosidase